jgi:hypothetical protein
MRPRHCGAQLCIGIACACRATPLAISLRKQPAFLIADISLPAGRRPLAMPATEVVFPRHAWLPEWRMPAALFIHKAERPRIRQRNPGESPGIPFTGPLATSVTTGAAGRRSGCNPATAWACGAAPALCSQMARRSARKWRAQLREPPHGIGVQKEDVFDIWLPQLEKGSNRASTPLRQSPCHKPRKCFNQLFLCGLFPYRR